MPRHRYSITKSRSTHILALLRTSSSSFKRLTRGQVYCPSGRQPYVSNGGARPCSTTDNLTTGCPTGSTCEFVPTNNPAFGRLCCLTGSTGRVQCALSTQVLINNNCYDVVGPNAPCTYSEQCGGGSSCVDSKCRCPTERISVGNVCIYNNVGVFTVRCTLPQVLVGDRCVQSARPDGACTYAQQCLGGSACIGGTCVCPYDRYNVLGECVQKCIEGIYVFYNGGCFQLGGPMATCQINEQCQGGSKCVGSICQCPNGQTAANGVCLSSVSVSACQPYNQILINGQCLNYVIAGQSCAFNQQCLGRSQCINGMCQCLGSDVNQGGTCVATSTLTSSGQIAACLPGQVSINGVCFAQVFPDNPCSYPAQCQAGSSCLSGYCRCSSGYFVSNGNCSPIPVQAQPTITCRTPGSSPYTDAATGLVSSCLTSVCPTNYKCEYNYDSSQYICCTVDATG